MRPAHAPAELLNGRPFRGDHARALGVSPDVLRGPRFRRVCREVYVAADAPDCPELRLAAIAMVLPKDAVLSGLSAAWLLGLDIATRGDGPLEVTAPRGTVLQGRGLFVPLQAHLDASDIVRRHGVLVTSPLRTAYDLARRLTLVEAVVAVDALWHRHLVTPDQLMDYAAVHGGLRGIRQIPRVAELADPGAESPMETRLRMLVVLDVGLPRPQTQLVTRDAAGKVVARLDMGFAGIRMGVEYDGEVHAEPAVRAKDLRRHNKLLAIQWHNLRYSADAYFKRRAEVIQEVGDTYAALSAGALRNDLGLLGLPGAK